MKIFKDSSLKEETKELDFGIVLAGDTKKITYWLYNDTEAEVVEIVPVVENKEVIVTNYSKSLKTKTSTPITFEWTASISVKRGLKSQFSLKFFELYS